MAGRKNTHRTFVIAAALGGLGTVSGARAALVTGLNYADGYGIFALNNATGSGGGSTGAVAIGGAATFSSYSLASGFSSSSTANTVVVGGAYSQTYGTTNGNVVVGGAATLVGPTLNGKLDVTGSVTHSGYGTYNGGITVGGDWTSANSGLTTGSFLKVGGNLNISGTTTVAGGLDVRGNAAINNPKISNGARVNGSVTSSGGGGTITGGLSYGTTFSAPSSIAGTQAANTAATVTPNPISIDFSAAGTWFKSAASSWGSLAANGTNALQYSTRTLTGTDPSLNVFSMASADFNFSTLNVNVPAGSTVLINVVGSSITAPNCGYNLNGLSMTSTTSGADDGKVLWNFVNATSVSINSLGGSIVAPYATVGMSNGTYIGTVVANNFNSNSITENYALFTGSLPSTDGGFGGANVVPEPSSAAAGAGAGLLLLRRRRRNA